MRHPTGLTRSSVLLYQDIFDYIIDELKDDLVALKECSLASRCLLHQSRRHLFHQVTLKPLDVKVGFRQLLISSSTPRYIKSCIIDGTHLTDYAKRRITIPTIQRLRDSLPRLTHLTLRGCTIESDLLHDKNVVDSTTSDIPLQLLELDHVTLIDTHHFPTLLLCFPSRELRLSQISVINYSTAHKIPDRMANRSRSSLGIRTLKCDAVKNEVAIFGVLTSLLRADSVEHLTISLRQSGLGACGKFLSVVASSVKELDITLFLDPRSSDLDNWNTLNLLSFTSLTSLTLKVHLESIVGPDRHWSKISSLLRDIPTSVAQRTFHYIISGADYHPAHPTSSEDRGGELSPSSHKKEEKFRVAGSIDSRVRAGTVHAHITNT